MKKVFSIIKKLALIAFLGKLKYARHLGVRVGEGSRVYISSWGSEPFLISIGSHTTVTSGVRFLTHDGATSIVFKGGRRYQKFLPIEVGDYCFIGVNSIILPGVKIGSNSIVAAGAVVTKDVPPSSIVAGNPARVISDIALYKDKVMREYVNDAEIESISSYKERVLKAIELYHERKN
ncbi:acyltransferase [Halomonas sp. Y3]|uniref:acyltransferase n=1 Tax=Halomonas sp. Y3 TaxID=2956797 RepID=UPI00209C76F3|nr:acyltransferase [Halomonas sp. Y3]